MKYRASRSPLTYLGGLLALYLAVPIGAFLIRLAQPGDRGFGTPGLWSALWTSVASATISMTIVALLGIPLAYWLARTRGPLTWMVNLIVLLPLALPPVMSGLVLIYLVGPYTWLGNLFNDELTGTIVGVVLAQTFVAGPFLIIAAKTAFSGVDPALDDLAASLGRRPASRFFLVSLRIAAPGIRAGLMMTWMRAIGEYGATVLLAYHPYTLPVFTYVQFSSTGIADTQAPTALAIGVAVVVLLLSEIRLARRRRRPPVLPAPAQPPRVEPVAVSFNLDLAVGTFRLRVAHQSASNKIAILGPSGAGKSITLRAIAGFLGRQAGTVEFNGEEVAGVRVEDRRVGYVPQGLVMFPGRTAWQQVLFAADADPAVAAWWLRTLRLDGLEGRLPEELSGGQRQRVGLARALSFRPRLVLLDEPFSALDAPVREELRRELRRLQREAGLSTVLVTHDPEEAALLADEILVVDEGRLLQAGLRAEVFARPASPQVARLLGIPNLIHAAVAGPGALRVGALRIAAETGHLPAGADVLWTIRPDHISVMPVGVDPNGGASLAVHGGVTRSDAMFPAPDREPRSGATCEGQGAGSTRSGADEVRPSFSGADDGALSRESSSFTTGRVQGNNGNRDAESFAENYPAVVEDVADIGTLTTLTVRLGTGQDPAPELRVRTTAAVALAPGDPCIVRLPPADITAWPAAPAQLGDPGRDRLPTR